LRRYGKNRHIMLYISECPGPILTYFTGLVGVLVGMIIPIFVWQSPKGRCYGNQLNLEDVRRHRQEWALLFASVFNNGLADRKSAFKRLNDNNPTTSYRNLVNFCPIIFEFTLLKCTIFGCNLTMIFICYVGVPNGLKDCNFDFRIVIDNHFCTSCRDFVRFRLVTTKFDIRSCTVSIENFSGVTSGTFSRERGC